MKKHGGIPFHEESDVCGSSQISSLEVNAALCECSLVERGLSSLPHVANPRSFVPIVATNRGNIMRDMHCSTFADHKEEFGPKYFGVENKSGD